ncbi:MAG: AAA family ATPase, partial [Actinomycetota bacterium]|nr:AAA family ATPase [Actinomycetota bacterium]
IEQIRRTDADRWAASFANIADQPGSAGQSESAAGNGNEEAPPGPDTPAWADRVADPLSGPSWHTDAPSRAWTTDVPTGLGWSADSRRGSADQAPPAPADWTRTRNSSGHAEGTPSPNGGAARDESGYDHSAVSRAAQERSAQAFSSNQPPPGYPGPPAHPGGPQQSDRPGGSDQYGQPYGGDQPGSDQRGRDQSYGGSQYENHAYGGQPPPGQEFGSQQYGGQPYGAQQGNRYAEPSHGNRRQADPHPGHQATGPAVPGPRYEAAPGSQSNWSAPPPAPAPTAPQAQQWQQAQAAQVGWQPASQQGPTPQQHNSAADLTSGSLVKPAAAVPRVGWRKMVHAVTGGTLNPGLSQAELQRRNLIERATAPVRGCHRIAVVSLKGGIGKTTTTAGLGLTLAEHRGDRVVALDANPDAGTLAERLTGQIDVTVRDLLDNVESIRSFTDVSAFTSLAARLQVLASEQDPEMSEAFNEEEYRTVADVLARYFNIVLTDSGTGLLHSAMSGTLALADSLVVVGSPSVDGASRASKTLDWLMAHGHGELVSRAVAVISTVRPATKELDMARLREHFSARVRAVVEIPYDRHLVTGGIIDMNQLDRPTEEAFLELSAIVADGFRLPPLIRSVRGPDATTGG